MTGEPYIGMEVWQNGPLLGRIIALSECKRYCVVRLCGRLYERRHKVTFNVSDLQSKEDWESLALRDPKRFINETLNLGKGNV